MILSESWNKPRMKFTWEDPPLHVWNLYVTFRGKPDLADEIKLRLSSGEVKLDYLSGLFINTRVLINGRQEAQNQREV